MTVFFLVIGLEVKRELTIGRLRDPRRASLPIVAALAGAAVPALVFLAFNPSGPAARGWAIPMATDPAFAVQLVAANLVYRRADRHDRRRVLIYLTARGRHLHARLAGKLGGIMGGVVDAAEVGRLTQLLLRVLQRLR
jgi:Na+/H+ antiporter 1